MADAKQPEFSTTIKWLIHNIDRFLAANYASHGWLDEEAFGWMACRDSGMMQRLRHDGDVRTSKMDDILAFIQNPIPPKRWKEAVLTPIKLTRRVYA